jgi:hypothetical protein
MPHSMTDRCPVCAGLVDYQKMLQGYIKDRCARLFSPQISAVLFNIQKRIKACTGGCTWTLEAVDLHSDASALLSEMWELSNEHRLYLEYAIRPYHSLKHSGINLVAMRGYLESHGLMSLRDTEATDADFAAALDKYLSLCEREGLHHIVDRWVRALEPEMEIPF